MTQASKIVGHTLINDLKVLEVEDNPEITSKVLDLRDISRYQNERRQPLGLKKLAWEHLGMKIQDGSHSSLEDARASLALYLLDNGKLLK